MIPNEKYVEIHIRRTDYTTAIKASSTGAFINKMNEIIEKQKDAKFSLRQMVYMAEKLKGIYESD